MTDHPPEIESPEGTAPDPSATSVQGNPLSTGKVDLVWSPTEMTFVPVADVDDGPADA